MPKSPAYLQPYLNAARRYGGGFGSLLWASPRSQGTRFAALLSAVEVNGKTVLDVGCGRADLHSYMLRNGKVPERYIGIEGVPELADAAEARRIGSTILRGDFVADPTLLQQQADIILISGSLNTMDDAAFHRTVAAAYTAAGEALAFNFLDAPTLAASPHLYWRKTEDVLSFCRSLCPDVRLINRYIDGDATVVMRKEIAPTAQKKTHKP